MPNRRPAVCPYYIRERKMEICCEGMRVGICTGVLFGSEEEKREWIRDFCGGFDDNLCPYARVIGGKYGKDAEKKMEGR